MQKHADDRKLAKKRGKKGAPRREPEREPPHAVEPRTGEGESPLEGAQVEGADVEGERPGREPAGGDIEGEGSYKAARRYDASVRDFIRSGEVEESAREAAEALDGPERERLSEAERSGKRGPEKP